jgi:ATP-dependent RNA helicase SUPV3L1/SUV3
VVADAPPAVPEMVEVWRPGGRSEERRPRHDRNRHHRHQGNQAPAQEGAQAVAATGEAGAGEKREHHRRGRRNNDFRKPRTDTPAVVASAPAEGGATPAEASQQPHQDQRPDQRNDRGRPPRERFEGKDREKGDRPNKFGGDRNKGDRGGRDKGGRDNNARDKGGRDKRDSGPSHRQWATTAAPRERDRPIDPNSPFAKLAALKEQLTAGRKD